MKINEALFRAILAELLDENMMACNGVLSLAGIRFTTEVSTLAVTLEDRPELLVNLEFLARHAQTEAHVKAVILHEFLHIILGHTERYKQVDDALNLALDAVINHIIHRLCGAEHSDFFASYYKNATGFARLLRPATEAEIREVPERLTPKARELRATQLGLICGKVLADDVLELVNAQRLAQWTLSLPKGTEFIGSHHAQRKCSPLVMDAIDKTLRSWNQGGIYRNPGRFLSDPNPFLQKAVPVEMRRWERAAWEILRDHMTRDRASQVTEEVPLTVLLPVLSPGDRRAFLRTLWNPILPEARWDLAERKPSGTCHVYLDVSGSMHHEMQALVGLLDRLRRFIRTPFWAFSDVVKPATIRNSQLVTETTGGTSINAVLQHVADTRPGKAVIITDGYIGACHPALLKRVRHSRQDLFAIVSRQGSTRELVNARIACRQLEKYPS